jgi:hypothetical protein
VMTCHDHRGEDRCVEHEKRELQPVIRWLVDGVSVRRGEDAPQRQEPLHRQPARTQWEIIPRCPRTLT